MDKQKVGFKFGKWSTEVLKRCGELDVDGRKYKLVMLKTGEDLTYYSLRLYNQKGRFIKQLMFEPWSLNGIIDLLVTEANSK